VFVLIQSSTRDGGRGEVSGWGLWGGAWGRG